MQQKKKSVIVQSAYNLRRQLVPFANGFGEKRRFKLVCVTSVFSDKFVIHTMRYLMGENM